MNSSSGREGGWWVQKKFKAANEAAAEAAMGRAMWATFLHEHPQKRPHNANDERGEELKIFTWTSKALCTARC